MSYSRKDANLQVTAALPNGAGVTSTAGINLDNPAGFDFDDGELEIVAPALAVGQLANAATMIYVVEHDTDPAFATATILHADAITQTGAGGVGAGGVTQRIALPTNVKSHIRVKATNSGVGNASTASVTVSLVL